MGGAQRYPSRFSTLAYRHERRSSQLHCRGPFLRRRQMSRITREILASGHKAAQQGDGFRKRSTHPTGFARRAPLISQHSDGTLMFLKIGRMVAFNSVLAFLVSIFLLSWLDNSYVTYSQAPDILSQRVVPYHVKGVVVYITESQRKILAVLTISEWISLSTFTLVVILSGGRAVSSRWPWRAAR